MSERKLKDAIFAQREPRRKARISWLPQGHKEAPKKSNEPPRVEYAPASSGAHVSAAPASPEGPEATSLSPLTPPLPPSALVEAQNALPPPPLASEALPASARGFFDALPEVPSQIIASAANNADAAIESFLQAAEALSEIHALRQSRVERDLVELARAIATRIIGRELTADPGILLALARDGIGALADRETAVVRFSATVPEELRDALTSQLVERAPGCSVVFDPELVSGACVVESAQGYVDESIGTRLDVVMEQLGFSRGGLS